MRRPPSRRITHAVRFIMVALGHSQWIMTPLVLWPAPVLCKGFMGVLWWAFLGFLRLAYALRRLLISNYSQFEEACMSAWGWVRTRCQDAARGSSEWFYIFVLVVFVVRILCLDAADAASDRTQGKVMWPVDKVPLFGSSVLYGVLVSSFARAYEVSAMIMCIANLIQCCESHERNPDL